MRPRWEADLRRAAARAANGRDPIERIDPEQKLIEITREITAPELLRSIEQAVKNIDPEYRVVQLT
jgi:hypothetical protein